MILNAPYLPSLWGWEAWTLRTQRHSLHLCTTSQCPSLLPNQPDSTAERFPVTWNQGSSSRGWGQGPKRHQEDTKWTSGRYSISTTIPLLGAAEPVRLVRLWPEHFWSSQPFFKMIHRYLWRIQPKAIYNNKAVLSSAFTQLYNNKQQLFWIRLTESRYWQNRQHLQPDGHFNYASVTSSGSNHY